MTKKKVNICALDTVYSLLLYLLIFNYNEDDIFIFTSRISEKIRKNFNYISFPDLFKYSMTSKLSINFLKRCVVLFYGVIKLNFLLLFKTYNKKVSLYGNPDLPLGYIFCIFEDSNVIEDGLMNYYELKLPKKRNKYLNKLLIYCGLYFDDTYAKLGTHPNIKKVFLTQSNVPKLIEDKAIVIDINLLWEKKSTKEKEDILKLFNCNSKTLIKNTEKSVLILTECLFEDSFLTYEEEVEIYKITIEKYKDYKIFIKPHPRDKKDYKTIFPNIEFIEPYIPIELLKFIGFKPTVVCSVVSTALLNFTGSEISVYEGELNSEELIEARVKLKEILKSNKSK